MANNFRRLKEEADIGAVISWLGVPTFSKGANVFIRCPLPDHEDNHPTNCYYKPGWNNVYCQRCARSIQAVDLIMYTAGLDYGAAADKLWEIEGCPEWYYEKREKCELKQQKFSITGKEAEIIDLKMPYSIGVEVYSSIDKPVSEECCSELDQNNNWYYILMKNIPVTWEDFVSESDLKRMVLERCKEKKALYDRLDAGLCPPDVNTLFAEERAIIAELEQRASA